MNPTILYILICVVILLLLLDIRLKRTKEEAQVRSEYWVYVRKDRLPNQHRITGDLFKRDEMSQQEGLLFSDVRLNIVQVLASKNLQLFHPDILDETVPADSPLWQECSTACALIMVRFVGAKPESDIRYLRLLPRLAMAIARLADGVGILDVGQRQLVSPAEFEKLCSADADPADADTNVRVHFQDIPAPEVHTWGLSKIGLRELTTGPLNADMRVLAASLLQAAAAKVWSAKKMPDQVDVEAYGQAYRLMPTAGRKGVENGRQVLRIFKVDQAQ